MQTITVGTETKAPLLDPTELGEFLFLFRAVTSALNRVVPEHRHQELQPATEQERLEWSRSLRQLTPRELNSLFGDSTHGSLVQIDRISRQSPLEITFCGCALLLVMGVIFSGGSVSISETTLRAKLPSLGHGIKALKEALGLGKRLEAGFGIKPKVIKLNQAEFKALMRQKPESRNQGGFQHFLVGLQHGINKQTHVLELSEGDLERIYRYKAHPKKGGWQSRFKKIFGRHFSADDDNQPSLIERGS